MRPRLAAVAAAVDAVAERRVVARVLLAGADVDDVGIRRRQRDLADRQHVLVVEDRLPGRAAVDGLPDAAVGAGHVEDERVAGHPDDDRDAAGLVGRPDAAEGQASKRVHLRRAGWGLLRAHGELGRRRERD